MRSIFVSGVVVVVGTLLALVQALGAEKVLNPVLPVRPVPAAHSRQGKIALNSGARPAHPSIDNNKWNSLLPDSENLAVNTKISNYPPPQHRRSYEAPLFLGKRNSQHYSAFNQRLRRSASFADGDDSVEASGEFQQLSSKRGFDVPQFLGKRGYNIPQFVGKRYGIPQFVGKRYGIPQFVGKRKYDIPQFLGKRGYAAPQFVGRRAFGPPQFVGKRGFSAPQFVGKRGYSVPAFVGKRDSDIPSDNEKRGFDQPMFVGRRAYGVPSFVGKRGIDVPAFIGKRKEESFRDLLATLQAYREYRRLMQTDKRFEAPLFVGKRSDSTSSAESTEVNELQR
ncbi:hypothetical protein SNE40_014586 [Patella caerulea]|uniref:Uncharacterized protein n=1 Tax=Patella caerulea TaxID=87958 RepID=A0AAN8JLD8_PATCE